MACDTCIGMPSDKVQKKINYAEMFGGKCISYTENTLCNAKFQQITKLIIKAFKCTEQQGNKKPFKVLLIKAAA